MAKSSKKKNLTRDEWLTLARTETEKLGAWRLGLAGSKTSNVKFARARRRAAAQALGAINNHDQSR